LRLGDKIIVIVGLPDAAVKEPRDRNSTVLTNSGFKFHSCRFTINLALAEVKKERSSFNFAFKVQDSFNPWQNPRENAFSPNYPLTKIRPYGSLFKHEKRRHSQFPLWQLVGHSRRRRWKPQPKGIEPQRTQRSQRMETLIKLANKLVVNEGCFF